MSATPSQSPQPTPAVTPLFHVLPDGRWSFMYDSSTIKPFSLCERQFHYQVLRNLRRKGRRASMDIGSWWSAVMSDFYEGMLAGTLTQQSALLSAARNWAALDMDALEEHDPRGFKSFGGRDGAITMIGRYHNRQADIDSKMWKIVSTEAGAGRRHEILVGENNKVVVYYVIKPDMLVVDQNRLCPVDHKTVDRISADLIKKYKPHDQIQGYIFGVGAIAKSIGWDLPVDRCIVNVCARTEPKDDAVRFTRVYPSYSLPEMQEWQARKVEQATRLRYCFENDVWLADDQACHIYSGCSYRLICAVPPGSRELVINADYVRVEPWVPYQIDD